MEILRLEKFPLQKYTSNFVIAKGMIKIYVGFCTHSPRVTHYFVIEDLNLLHFLWSFRFGIKGKCVLWTSCTMMSWSCLNQLHYIVLPASEKLIVEI